MVNTEIRLIIFFTAKYGEALYIEPNMEKLYTLSKKQDQELTVAQIIIP